MLPLDQVVNLAEKSAVCSLSGTTVGCIVGRVLLPAIWKDLKRRLKHE